VRWAVDPAAAAAADDGVADASPVQNAITPRAGCSIVQFCNAPGSDGTVCLQQGCSLAAAQAECSLEAPIVYGKLALEFGDDALVLEIEPGERIAAGRAVRGGRRLVSGHLGRGTGAELEHQHGGE